MCEWVNAKVESGGILCKMERQLSSVDSPISSDRMIEVKGNTWDAHWVWLAAI